MILILYFCRLCRSNGDCSTKTRGYGLHHTWRAKSPLDGKSTRICSYEFSCLPFIDSWRWWRELSETQQAHWKRYVLLDIRFKLKLCKPQSTIFLFNSFWRMKPEILTMLLLFLVIFVTHMLISCWLIKNDLGNIFWLSLTSKRTQILLCSLPNSVNIWIFFFLVSLRLCLACLCLFLACGRQLTILSNAGYCWE